MSKKKENKKVRTSYTYVSGGKISRPRVKKTIRDLKTGDAVTYSNLFDPSDANHVNAKLDDVFTQDEASVTLPVFLGFLVTICFVFVVVLILTIAACS